MSFATSKTQGDMAPPRAARPMVTCYLMPPAFSAVASLPHTAAVPAANSFMFLWLPRLPSTAATNHSFSEVCGAVPVCEAGAPMSLGPDHVWAWRPSHHFLCSVSFGVCENWAVTQAPRSTSCVTMDEFLLSCTSAVLDVKNVIKCDTLGCSPLECILCLIKLLCLYLLDPLMNSFSIRVRVEVLPSAQGDLPALDCPTAVL